MPPKKMHTALKAKKGLDLSKSHPSKESMGSNVCVITHIPFQMNLYIVLLGAQYIDSSVDE